MLGGHKRVFALKRVEARHNTLETTIERQTPHNTAMDGGNPNPMDGQSAAASSSSPASYAFFNHSTSTLPHQLPPNVDDKPLARQKRKRTRYIASMSVRDVALTRDTARKTRLCSRALTTGIQSPIRRRVWRSSETWRWERKKSRYLAQCTSGLPGHSDIS